MKYASTIVLPSALTEEENLHTHLKWWAWINYSVLFKWKSKTPLVLLLNYQQIIHPQLCDCLQWHWHHLVDNSLQVQVFMSAPANILWSVSIFTDCILMCGALHLEVMWHRTYLDSGALFDLIVIIWTAALVAAVRALKDQRSEKIPIHKQTHNRCKA